MVRINLCLITANMHINSICKSTNIGKYRFKHPKFSVTSAFLHPPSVYATIVLTDGPKTRFIELDYFPGRIRVVTAHESKLYNLSLSFYIYTPMLLP